MIVTVDSGDKHDEYYVPQEWRPTVLSLLQTIDDYVMKGRGRTVQPRLLAAGPLAIHVIEIIRRYYGLSLKQAKILVIDRCPCALPSLPYVTAGKMLMELEKEGASAELPSAVEQLGALAKNENTVHAAIAATNGGEAR